MGKGKAVRKTSAADVALDQSKTARVVARWTALAELPKMVSTLVKALASVAAPVATVRELKDGHFDAFVAGFGVLIFVVGGLLLFKLHRDRNEKQRQRGRIDVLEEENRRLVEEVNQLKGEVKGLRNPRGRG